MMHPVIARELAKLQAAERTFQNVIKREQEKCKHASVLHYKGRYGEFGRFNAMRICLGCGYEEHATKPAWGSKNDHMFRVLKTNDFHREVEDSNEICKHRIPHAPIHQVK